MAHGKVVKYELEDLVLGLRRQGRNREQIAEACNQALDDRDIDDDLHPSAIDRYIASLDRESVPEVHRPQAAAKVARVLRVDVIDRMNSLDELLAGWLDEAKSAEKTVQVGYGETATYETVPDWHARAAMSREMREHVRAVGELLERVYNAEQVQAFQESVTEAIREASPETAQAVLAKLRDRQSLRARALLGEAV